MAANSLVGTWKAVAIWAETAEGQVSYPWGQQPVGFITYTADGRMAAAIMSGERPRTSAARTTELSIEEKAAAYDSYQGYAGTYEVQAEAIVHHVEASLNPNWPGHDLVRPFKIEGDRLSLEVSRVIAGVMQTQKLVWERV